MLIEKQKKLILDELGVVTWRPRKVTCMILLSHRQNNPIILEGMIKVLALPPENIVRVIVKNLEPTVVASKIELWKPKFILQLSMDFPEIIGEQVVRTYSPDYLAVNPKDKASAYKQLLKLRELLQNDAA